MKDHRELFGNYKKGILDDARIEELHRMLVEVYFSDKEKLDEEEKEYAEDLIFELYAKNGLSEANTQKFSALIERDKVLNKRFNILKSLVNPEKADRDSRRRLAVESEKADEQEEEELKSVLKEVLEKAHAEEEAKPVWLDNLVASLKNFFNDLTLPDIRFQPQLRFALNVMSQAAVIVFMVTTYDQNPEMLSGEDAKIALDKSIQYQAFSPGNSQKKIKKKDIIKLGKSSEVALTQNDQKVPAVNQKMDLNESSQMAQNTKPSGSTLTNEYDGLCASMYAPPGFEYSLSRGENPDITQRLARASFKYNGDLGPKDYDSCIIMLEKIMDEKVITNKDTLNMIRYYLGNSYLKVGIDSDSKKKIEKALLAFIAIDPQNKYYLDAKWYCALAYLKLGKADESLRLCDTLVGLNDLRYIKAEALRDSINKMISK